MSSSLRRRFSACVLVGVMLVGSVSTAAAAGRTDDPPVAKLGIELALATDALFVPAPLSPIFATDGQTTQSVMRMPRSDDGVFAAPALRRSLIVSFGALQALDAFSTMKALKAGGRETNPAMAGIASNRGALLAVKAGTAVATAYFAERLSRNHPKRAIVLMAVLNAAYAGIVVHNYRVARGAR